LKPIVLYSSKGGNTEKVASEIASELNCPCIKITKDFNSSTVNLRDFDLVFLGTGIYGAKPNAELLNYLNEMNPKNNINFALFITWVGRGTTDKAVYDKIKATVEAKGQRLLENYYSCLFEGRSIIARFIFPDTKGHPTTEDLSNARKWASELTKEI
jgi:flavodoxin